MKTRYLIVIIIAGVILFVTSAINFFKGPKEGDAAPAFTLKAVEGEDVSLADFRGMIVFLHFWAPWCTTCISELPAIEKIHDDFKGKGVEVLSVLVDDDGANIPVIKNHVPINYPVLVDPAGEVADRYQVWGVPETFIVGKDGKILNRTASAESYEEMKRRLDGYLSK